MTSPLYALDLSVSPPAAFRAGRGPLPLDALPADALRSGSARLVVAAPAAATLLRPLVAPFASRSKAARVWPSLLDASLPFPVEAAAAVYTPPVVARGQTSSLAAAIRLSDLRSFLDAPPLKVIPPALAFPESLALWPLHAAVASRPDAPSALVHLAGDHLSLLLGRGSDLLSAHVVRAAPASLSPDALRSRLLRILPSPEPLSVWWSGPAAAPDTLARLQSAFPPAARHALHDDPASFLLRALLRLAETPGAPDFLVGPLAPPARLRRAARRANALSLAVILLSLALFGLSAAVRTLHANRLAALKSRIASAAARIVPSPLPGLELVLSERADADAAEFWNAVDLLRAPPALEPRVLEAVRALHSASAVVSRFSADSSSLSAAGSVPSADPLRSIPGWSVEISSPSPGSFALKGLPQ